MGTKGQNACNGKSDDVKMGPTKTNRHDYNFSGTGSIRADTSVEIVWTTMAQMDSGEYIHTQHMASKATRR
jgi:hypothetical protein